VQGKINRGGNMMYLKELNQFFQDESVKIPNEAIYGTFYAYGGGHVGYLILPVRDHWIGVAQYGATCEEGFWIPSSYSPIEVVGENLGDVLDQLRELYE